MYGARHYLIAWCGEAKDIRTFTLANIKEISLTDEFFERQNGFDLQTYSERSFGVFQDEPVKVRWKFKASIADDVREHMFHPTQTIEELEDGSVIVSFTAAGLHEMCWHLFTWGDDVEVLEPSKLKDQYATMVRSVMPLLGIQEAQ